MILNVEGTETEAIIKQRSPPLLIRNQRCAWLMTLLVSCGSLTRWKRGKKKLRYEWHHRPDNPANKILALSGEQKKMIQFMYWVVCTCEYPGRRTRVLDARDIEKLPEILLLGSQTNWTRTRVHIVFINAKHSWHLQTNKHITFLSRHWGSTPR